MIPGKFNIVTDGAWGSTGKGNIATAIAAKYRPHILSTTNYPNAGHTAVNTDGKAFVAKALPSPSILTKWLQKYKPHIVIGGAAAFNIDQLMHEVQLCGINYNLSIHPRAGVVTDAHKLAESGNGESSTKHLASTMQGCGAFMADKILRKKELKLARDHAELMGFMANHLPKKLPFDAYAQQKLEDLALPELLHTLMVTHGYTILHEGAQGFSLDITHGSHYPQCYDPSSLVTVKDLNDKVLNLRMIDVVERPNNFPKIMDRGNQWVELQDAWSKQTDERLLAITCGHNVLTVTENHPVVIERGGVTMEVPAKDVCGEDWVTTPTPKRHLTTVYKHLTASMAYILGYYLGDGWIVGDRRDQPHKKDKKLEQTNCERYREKKKAGLLEVPVTKTPTTTRRKTQAFFVSFSSEDFFYLPAHLALEGYNIAIRPHEKTSKANRLRVYSSQLARFIVDLGITSEGAINKRLPADFMEYDDLSLAAILAGYIDADGCTYNNRIAFGVTSLTLCLQWQKWLQSLGIKCIIRPRKKYGNGFGTNMKSNHWCMEIRFHANQADHPVLLRLIKISAKMHNYRPSKANWEIENNDRERSAFYHGKSKVLRVTTIHQDEVCDITTSSGTFLVNGIVGHNCTSRGTTAIQNMADMGISPRDLGDIYLVIRPYPIRVGSLVIDGKQVGYSGDAYPNQKEITWEQVAKESGMPTEEAEKLKTKELTTVTKRLRRVFEFSERQLREAALVNGATKIALNFANYLDWSCFGTNDYEKLPPKVKDFITMIEDVTKLPVTVVGTGPQFNHVCFM